MKYSSFTDRKLWLAVNSHGWEDFPVHHKGEQASELLASWGALWHPAVLQGARQLPKWHRIDALPEPAKGSVVVVPEFSRALLADELVSQLAGLGGVFCFGTSNRDNIIRNILDECGNTHYSFHERTINDFFSLGYCYLQVQLMTRQLRYVSTLDNAVLGCKLFEAVDAAATGLDAKCHEMLQGCFDQLLQERNRYYPTCASLIDCVYITNETLGPELFKTLQQPQHMTIQAAGCVWEKIAKTPEKSALKQKIQDRIDAGRLTMAVGPWSELASPLLSVSTLINQMIRGRTAAQNAFPNANISTYATRRFGLSRSLPGILKLAGYTSVIHATLDDGKFPQTTNNNMRWQGDDSSTIDALATPPRLAAAAESWLGIGITIGELIDSQHYGSLFVVHWPGEECDSYADLVNSSRFGDIIGRFVTLDEYFEQVSDPGYSQNYRADDYRNPFLSQSVEAKLVDPITRFAKYWRRTVELQAIQGLEAMLMAMGQVEQSERRLDLETIELAIGQATETAENPENIRELNDLRSWQTQLASRFVERSFGGRKGDENVSQIGTIVVNPFAFSRKCIVSGRPANVPACGFSWVSNSKPVETSTKKRWLGKSKLVPMVLEGKTIQNEFFILEVNTATGGIGAIQLHNRRGSLVSQRLALRKPSTVVSRGGKNGGKYSKMVADVIRVVEDSDLIGTIESTGRLVLDSRDVGSFRQRMHMERGSPLVEIEVAVELADSISGNPWESYLASRIAWNNEAADFHTWLYETRQSTSLNRVVAPIALEIDQHPERICLLPGGLPFHQRVGYRKLDTLLVTQGEMSRVWKFAIGVNVAYPLTAAIDVMCRPIEIPDISMGMQDPFSGWIFHLNCKNVAVVRWKPRNEDSASMLIVVRETEGRSANVTLDCARPIRQSWACDLSGNRLHELVVLDGKSQWEMVAHELAHVEVVW